METPAHYPSEESDQQPRPYSAFRLAKRILEHMVWLYNDSEYVTVDPSGQYRISDEIKPKLTEFRLPSDVVSDEGEVPELLHHKLIIDGPLNFATESDGPVLQEADELSLRLVSWQGNGQNDAVVESLGVVRNEPGSTVEHQHQEALISHLEDAARRSGVGLPE